MAESNCAECKLRARYDEKPKSFAGRFWRWHINWCPGWKGYMKSLDDMERAEIKQQYHLK
ncbi:hypothetical protein [uncultured Draconibacterium sp.]|uniref:hypothetical protein n=1 Tax=uncultured Draconibacterium sp. TaxID=1573823 RepID=UPI002AA89A02|nr:hypothetical protein [uncultured Draconibacterium sp.]